MISRTKTRWIHVERSDWPRSISLTIYPFVRSCAIQTVSRYQLREFKTSSCNLTAYRMLENASGKLYQPVSFAERSRKCPIDVGFRINHLDVSNFVFVVSIFKWNRPINRPNLLHILWRIKKERCELEANGKRVIAPNSQMSISHGNRNIRVENFLRF